MPHKGIPWKKTAMESLATVFVSNGAKQDDVHYHSKS
jgi:hypothetical protein